MRYILTFDPKIFITDRSNAVIRPLFILRFVLMTVSFKN